MLYKAILQSFDPATYLATIEPVGSMPASVERVPVSRAIPAAQMVAGRSLAVVSFSPSNPGDGVVVGVWG